MDKYCDKERSFTKRRSEFACKQSKKLNEENGIIDQPSRLKKNVNIGANIKLNVLELAGIKNILSKQLGSNNQLNNARATILGLSKLKSYNAASN